MNFTVKSVSTFLGPLFPAVEPVDIQWYAQILLRLDNESNSDILQGRNVVGIQADCHGRLIELAHRRVICCADKYEK